MKTLFRLLCVATFFTFVACSSEQKPDEIWVKVNDKRDGLEYGWTKKGDWYVIKLTDEDVKNGYILSEGSMSLNVAIGRQACITEVRLPSSITKIDYCAFYDCSRLKNIVIPSSVEEIGECAFYGCSSLLSIEIPAKVKKIGKNAFRNCKSLESVIIPHSVNEIGEGAFSGCCMPFVNVPKRLNVEGVFDSDVIIYRK